MRKWHQVTGGLIMQILLSESGATLGELLKHLGVSETRSGSVIMDVYNCLFFLSDAGLITIDGMDSSNDLMSFLQMKKNNHKIRASNLFLKVKTALNSTVSDDRNISKFSLTVSPFFGSPDNIPKQTDVFVIMPFADSFKAIYTDHIKQCIEITGLSVSRADEYLTAKPIMSDVWSGIYGSGVVIADCTGRNPNVFYEMGVAHTLGKPVIIITQNGDDVPSDLRHIKYLKYVFTPRGMKEFEYHLTETIKNTLMIY